MNRAAAILLRLGLVPCGLLYGWLSLGADSRHVTVVAGLFLCAFVAVILRGLDEEMGAVEGGILAIIIGAAGLATLPSLASRYTPGVCTDQSQVYEIALVALMYLGTITGAHLIGKSGQRTNVFSMSDAQYRAVSRTPSWLCWLIPALLLSPAFILLAEGVCAPGNAYMLVMPAMTLPALGLSVFSAGAVLRMRRSITRSTRSSS